MPTENGRSVTDVREEIEQEHRRLSQCTHGELPLSGMANLTNHQHIQRPPEDAGHHRGHDHTTAWQSQDDIGWDPPGQQVLAELPAGLFA